MTNSLARFSSQDFSPDRLRPEAGPARAQSFGRFEFKYILPNPLASLLESELRAFMEVDPFCRDRPDQSYLVHSLYFDSPDFACYYEKIDGMLDREKFRLRTYDDSGSSPCYLELKGRQNHFSYKHRTPLDARLYGLVESGRWSALAVAGGPAVLERFAATACRRRLTPQVLVEYRRRPYVSRRDFRFRVTFDRGLRGAAAARLHRPAARAAAVLPGHTVLEIKFEHAVPAWFQRLIAAYELRRVSISKYCRAAEALTLVRNLE